MIPHSLTVFVTGAAGFIGRRLVEMLLESGHSVIAHDLRMPTPPSSSDSAFENPSLVSGNLVCGEGLERLGECDAVVHLAAAGAKASSRRWDACTQVNVAGTQSLLSALGRSPRAPMLVFPRTFYQDHLAEAPALWENPYIATKEAATRLVERWMSQDRPDARVVIATLFQVYGPGDDPDNLVSYAIRQLRAGGAVQCGNGTALRDWIYLDDLVSAILAALSHLFAASARPLLRCDLGMGCGHSARHVVGEIAGQLGAAARVSFDPTRDRGDSGISGTAKAPVPGWAPAYSLTTGLARTIRLVS